MNRKTIGDRIKERRSICGMSQVDLADKIDVSKQTLYKYESGTVTNIPSDKIEKMAEAFNVSPCYLMGWEELETEYDKNEKRLLKIFKQLNDSGQKEVIKCAENLTYNPSYKKATKVDFKKHGEEIHVIAAHNDDRSPEQVELMKKDIENLLNDD